MTDWKQVAEQLRQIKVSLHEHHEELAAAIRLCKLAAKLPAGEAERVLEEVANGDIGNANHEIGVRMKVFERGYTQGYMTCKRGFPPAYLRPVQGDE